MTARRIMLAALICGAMLAPACSSDGDGSATSTTKAARSVDVGEVLGALADDVVIPSYVALDDAMADLLAATETLCTSPSPTALTSAQDGWKAALAQWQQTRAGALGPAMDDRLLSAIAFAARPKLVAALIASDDPVDTESLSEEGAAVRGLYALEVALFGDGSDALASAGGARRCEYAASITALSAQAVDDVTEQWTDGDARQAFVEGEGGDPQTTVAGLGNEVSRRLNELDTVQLRDMTEAAGPEELNDVRSDGPAAYRLADRKATMAGISAIIGDGTNGLSALAAGQSSDLADRLVAGRDDAEEAMAQLPDSVTAAFENPDQVAAASQAVADLKVLVSTEVASQLGITITFSDSDGDA